MTELSKLSFQETKETWVKAKGSLWVTGSLAVAGAAIVALVILGPIIKHHADQDRLFEAMAKKFYHQSNWNLYDQYMILSAEAAGKAVLEGYAITGLSITTVGALASVVYHIKKIHRQRQVDIAQQQTDTRVLALSNEQREFGNQDL